MGVARCAVLVEVVCKSGKALAEDTAEAGTAAAREWRRATKAGLFGGDELRRCNS